MEKTRERGKNIEGCNWACPNVRALIGHILGRQRLSAEASLPEDIVFESTDLSAMSACWMLAEITLEKKV
jgi:hypothetical protein